MTRADSLGSPAALLGTPLVRQTSGAKRWLDRYRELVAARGGAGSLTREDRSPSR